MSESRTLTIQLSAEDGARLEAEAQRLNLPPENLASAMLHISLAQVKQPVFPSVADIESLKRLYTLREPAEIWNFLSLYPFVIPVLLEAPDKIRHYFPDEQLFLEVVPDPEITDYVQLVLSILTKLDPHEAMNREDRLRKDWWFSVSREVRSLLSILFEFLDEF